MNQRTYVQLEIVKNEKSYILSVPFGANYQDCYDAAIEIANNIVQLSKEAQEAADKAKAEQELVDAASEVEPAIQDVSIESVAAVNVEDLSVEEPQGV